MNRTLVITDKFTFIACVVIIVAFAASWLYIVTKEGKEFAEKRKWIEQLPSIISTLGVLGTFLGITKGLISFDTENLDTSIPILLDGLKTAFFTSLCGMLGSMVLNRTVSRKLDSEQHDSETIKAANLIVSELSKNHNATTTLLKTHNSNLMEAINENGTIKAIRQDVEQLKDNLEEIKGHVEELKGVSAEMKSHFEGTVDTIVSELENIKNGTHSNADAISKVRAVLVTATASISAIDNNVEELCNTVSGISSDITEINENLAEVQSYAANSHDD